MKEIEMGNTFTHEQVAVLCGGCIPWHGGLWDKADHFEVVIGEDGHAVLVPFSSEGRIGINGIMLRYEISGPRFI